MKIFNYFLSITDEINKLNSFINETENCKDLYNPFIDTIPKTYVWIEKEKN